MWPSLRKQIAEQKMGYCQGVGGGEPDRRIGLRKEDNTTIYKVKDSHGHILRYQARIERKTTGKMRKSFATLKEAIAWVTRLHNEIPCQSAGWATQEVRVKDLIIKGNDRRGGMLILNRQTMTANGCVLTRGPGRCAPMDDCPHYDRKGGCLDMAERAGWEGFSAWPGI